MQRFAPPLPTLLSLALLGPALAAQDLGTQVREMIGRAEAAPVERVWSIGRQLGELEGKEDALARAIRAQVDKAGPKGRLAAAAALMDLSEGSEFGKDILDAIQPALKSKDVDVVKAALSIAARDRFFSRRVQDDVRTAVRPLAIDDLTDPVIRVAAAHALWRVGTTADQNDSRRVLKDFVRSSERRLQVMGALALAELNAGSQSEGWPVLQDIAGEPTLEGRLAAAYIQIENQRRLFDARIPRVADGPGPQPGSAGPDDLELLREIMRSVRTHHVRGDKAERKRMIESAARGLLRALDRHSTYFSSKEFQDFYFDLNPEYGGIGAFVDFDRDKVFSIVRPIYSGPAYEANLRSGDKILEVDGWDTMNKEQDEIIKRLKGRPGTPVTIKVFRAGWTDPKEVTVTRRKIQVPSVNHELLPGNVGYVEIITFGGSTSEELAAALLDLKRVGATGIVLDLRNNTGGYLQTAKEVVELFVQGRKLVVYTKGRVGPRQDYRTEDRAIFPDIPLTVLINDFSASASEITAGALQDHGRATIVGERSFGKGSVQTLLQLSTETPEEFKDLDRNGQWDEGEPYVDANKNGKYDIGPRIKVTTAHYYLPSGRCVDKQLDEDGKVIDPDWGVRPDKPMPLLDNPVRDRWKEAVVYDLLAKDVFRKYVSKHLPGNKELFVQLAEGDGGSAARYPGFEEFYTSLDTRLPRDDVRRWLRYQIRDDVADLRSKAFPGGRALGDFQEDMQLQEGVRSVLEKQKKDIREIAAYKPVLKIPFDEARPEKDKKDSDRR